MAGKPGGNPYDSIGPNTNAAQINLMGAIPLLRNVAWYREQIKAALEQTEGTPADIDYDGIAARMDQMNKHRCAMLVRFFKTLPDATVQDIMDDCYGADYADSTVRSYVSQTNALLKGPEFMSRLHFDIKLSKVIKKIDLA